MNELMRMENNGLAVEENDNLIVDLTAGKQVAYCSVRANTQKEQLVLMNKIQNCTKRLSDEINTSIEVKDIYAEIVTVTNKQTGEISQAPRIVLIDTEGEGHQCVSFGIYNYIKKLFQDPLIGTPDNWEEPFTFVIKQRPTSNGFKILTLEFAG